MKLTRDVIGPGYFCKPPKRDDVRWMDAWYPFKPEAEFAWVIIANVSGGDWSKQSKDWVKAVKKWRIRYCKLVKKHGLKTA